MKEKIMNYAPAYLIEYWTPSARLRFVKRKVVDFSSQLVGGLQLEKEVNILQQLFTSNLGNVRWEDVSVGTES